jgi:large subunit ribosomal protein L37Ae
MLEKMATQYGTVKRLGVRYGATIKLRLAVAEADQRRRQKCPYCSSKKVKRISLGIWQCGNCKAKFSGRAYTVMHRKREDIKAKGV